MSIAQQIENIRTHIGNAYTACQEKESTAIPTNKNLVNLPAAIKAIPDNKYKGTLKNYIVDNSSAAIEKGDFVTLLNDYNFGDVTSISVSDLAVYPYTTGCILQDNVVVVVWYGKNGNETSIYAQVYTYNTAGLQTWGSRQTILASLGTDISSTAYSTLKIKKLNDTTVVIMAIYNAAPVFFVANVYSADGHSPRGVLCSNTSITPSAASRGIDIWFNDGATTGWLFYSAKENICVRTVDLSSGTVGTETQLLTMDGIVYNLKVEIGTKVTDASDGTDWKWRLMIETTDFYIQRLQGLLGSSITLLGDLHSNRNCWRQYELLVFINPYGFFFISYNYIFNKFLGI